MSLAVLGPQAATSSPRVSRTLRSRSQDARSCHSLAEREPV